MTEQEKMENDKRVEEHLTHVARNLTAYINHMIEKEGYCTLREANDEMYRLMHNGDERKRRRARDFVEDQIAWTRVDDNIFVGGLE